MSHILFINAHSILEFHVGNGAGGGGRAGDIMAQWSCSNASEKQFWFTMHRVIRKYMDDAALVCPHHSPATTGEI